MSIRSCRYCQQVFQLSRYHRHQAVCSRPDRQRQRARVTDQSSLRTSPYVNLTVLPTREPREAPPPPGFRPSSGAEIRAGWVVCQICGRQGRWINPFVR